MKDVKHTQLLSNQSSGCLLQSQQSATHIQTEHSDERVKNKTENSLLLLNYVVFLCKNLDNIIRDLRNHYKIIKVVHDPFNQKFAGPRQLRPNYVFTLLL